MKNCNICHKNISAFHKTLKNYPVTNLYLETENCALNVFDIDIYQCNCGHVFASSQQADIYSSSYAYNGNAEGVQLRREIGLSMLKEKLGDLNLNSVVDIGGGQLQMIKVVMQNWKTLRQIVVDPVPIEKNKIDLQGIEFFNEFFDGNNFKLENSIYPSLFLLDNVLEHIEKLSDFMDAIARTSQVNDYIYVCVPSYEVIYEKLQFQEIIHEHVNYFSKEIVNNLFSNFGFLNLYSFTDYSGARGYNYHLFIKSKSINFIINSIPDFNFEKRLNYYQIILESTLNNISNIKKPIYGVCASELTPTLAYHMQSDLSFCKVIFDTSEHKINKYMPLVKPKIVNFENIKNTSENSYFYVTAPSIGRKVLTNLSLIGRNNIIFPVNIL